MLSNTLEKQLTKIMTYGLLIVSVAISFDGLTDPVNVPKFLLLGILSFASLGLLATEKVNYFHQREWNLIYLFLFFSFLAAIFSKSPFSQNLYGSYGRNNGLLTYLFLSIIFIVCSTIGKRENHLTILRALLYAGYTNLAYCAWVIAFGDFMPWSNPYQNILGTFGNPNFIGAFLGIFFGVLVAFGLGKESSKRFRISLFFLIPLTIFEIVDSRAIQGRVLAALSLGMVCFFYLRFKISRFGLAAYLVITTTLGGLALAGAFQKGPLTEIIYKTSVSLRGQYWLAAWNTGESHPLVGVGMDSFGDWYRRARDSRAIELPGVNTVVNTAHNVSLDMFAFGGWPLFIAYLLILVMALKSIVIIAMKMREYDSVAVALLTAWTCYQVQSIISINQIGLAIWGWALSGAVIGYERYNFRILHQQDSRSTKLNNKNSSNLSPKALLRLSFFSLLGLLISLPPLTGDSSWRTAQISGDATKLMKSMEPTYFNPLNSQMLLLNTQLLENNKLFDLSHQSALKAVKWNPESFDLWRNLYLVRNSTEEEKALALRKMKQLDPLNPDVTAQ